MECTVTNNVDIPGLLCQTNLLQGHLIIQPFLFTVVAVVEEIDKRYIIHAKTQAIHHISFTPKQIAVRAGRCSEKWKREIATRS